MRNTASKSTDHQANTDSGFEREAEVVLDELRPALAEVINRLRPPVRRVADLRRMLNLGQKVSWGLFNAATAGDARALASLLPGRRAMERFFAASEEHGVTPELIGRARAAFERFEDSVARHAGSRDTFETMVAELGAGNGEPGSADLKHKRAVFRGMSQLWGRQARVCSSTEIMHPSAVPGMMDTVIIKGMVGLRRTRRAGPLQMMSRHWSWATPGEPEEPSPPEPLDPRETGPEAIGLLQDFCSQPLPEFRLRESRPGFRSHELVSKTLGAEGEVTYFTGEAFRADTAAPGSVPGSEATIAKTVDIPIEVYTGDILVHRTLWDTQVPEVRVYACRLDGSREYRDSELLPLTEQAEYLGEGLYAARTMLMPRYTEMLSYAMERMGWKGEEFRVFRCRVDYPVLSSRIRMTLRRASD
jgi:hypothetical protein